MIKGTAPFEYAIKNDPFFSLLNSQNPEDLKKYWTVMKCNSMTNEFKDLVRRLLSYKEENRPTDIDEIYKHPFVCKKHNNKEIETVLQMVMKQLVKPFNTEAHNEDCSSCDLSSQEDSHGTPEKQMNEDTPDYRENYLIQTKAWISNYCYTKNYFAFK